MPDDLTALQDAVRERTGVEPPALAIVLGSGLGPLVDHLEDPASFDYGDFPCFPPLQIAGHRGRLVWGRLDGVRVLVFQGRFHCYQGLSARQAALPARVAQALGAPRLLLTNAVGGINPAYRTGEFMYVADHLNLLGDNPLKGEIANPFVDLGNLYRQQYHAPLAEWAATEGLRLHRGVLAVMPGPSYETPAEIRALWRMGADVVGMSTAPEAILGHYLGLEVVALSFVANAAAGLSPAGLSHSEVLAAAAAQTDAFCRLVRQLCSLWVSSPRP